MMMKKQLSSLLLLNLGLYLGSGGGAPYYYVQGVEDDRRLSTDDHTAVFDTDGQIENQLLLRRGAGGCMSIVDHPSSQGPCARTTAVTCTV